MTTATIYTVRRSAHTVHFVVGDSIAHADHKVEWDGPGEAETGRSSRSAILGDTGYVNLSWSAEVNRETPHHEDQFPIDMPDTIANMTVYGREDRTQGTTPTPPLEYTKMDHLHVQEEARGMGFGLLVWDVYLTLSAAIGGDARGKVGDNEDADTVTFLERQGVPRSDIEYHDGGGWLGTHTAIWDTDVSNITAVAPLETRTEQIG